MENQILISIPADQFWQKMTKLIDERTQQIINSTVPKQPQIYSFTKVGKMLGRKPETIKKLVMAGTIQSTDDGKITQQAINDYLKESS